MGPEGGGDSHQSHSLDQPVESVLPLIRAPHVEQREEAIEMGLGCFNVADATLLCKSRQSSTFNSAARRILALDADTKNRICGCLPQSGLELQWY